MTTATPVDPPHPPSFPLTQVAELGYIRSYGVEMCQDNGLEAVTFTYGPRGTFAVDFTVTAEGFVETDFQPEDEMKELQNG